MADWTRMLVQDIPLPLVTCDWQQQRFTCKVRVSPDSTALAPLWDVITTQRLTTCHLQPGRYDSRLTMPLSFAAYLADWRCDAVRPDLQEHTLVFVMSGPPWRDDDTPVESHNALWELMGFPRMDTAQEAPPRMRKKRRDAGQPRKRKPASLTT